MMAAAAMSVRAVSALQAASGAAAAPGSALSGACLKSNSSGAAGIAGVDGSREFGAVAVVRNGTRGSPSALARASRARDPVKAAHPELLASRWCGRGPENLLWAPSPGWHSCEGKRPHVTLARLGEDSNPDCSSRTTRGLGSVSSSFHRGGAGARGVQVRQLRQTRAAAWFKFGSNGLDSEGAGIYGSQGRDDFDRDDVEQYFNYMGMLATEGTYDKMEALLNTGIPPVDILLLLAASEGDEPKIEELIRAGADYRVKDDQGRNALDRAKIEEIRELILNLSKVKA